jgi:glyoxylase-like metal-dependent hydrolase (beta-lactamase superfamily II)
MACDRSRPLSRVAGALTFPNAVHYLSETEWAVAEGRAAQDDDYAPVFGILRSVRQAGRMVLINGDVEIVPGIHVLAAPGETDGHQIVRIHSAGHSAYVLGDLYHHPLEITHDDVVSIWSDPAKKRASRAALLAAVRKDNPLLITAHISGVGRIVFADDGRASWQAVAIPPLR